MGLRKLLVIPQLVWYGVRAPREQKAAWERFWSGIRKTGPGGEVLWDAASREELDWVLARVGSHMDTALPVVDFGCGNGRFSRLLAQRFPKVLGLDVSASAIAKAKAESSGVENVAFRVMDMSVAGAGAILAAELGEANVFMRGVFHVFGDSERANAIESLRAMVGARGAVYFAETNYEGDPLDQLVAQGATPTSMPEPLRKCIAAGIRPPRHFGETQLREMFPRGAWEVLESGPMTMRGVPLTRGEETEPIPSYYGIVRAAR